MHLPRNAAKATTIALVLVIASVALMTMPIQAQDEESHGGTGGALTGGAPPAGATWNTTVHILAYMSVGPSPVGVGQLITVNIWTSPAPGAGRARTGYLVTITKPDATVTKIGPINSYVADGTSWFTYVPDTAGTYKFKFDAPADYYPTGRYQNGVLMTNNTGTQYDSALYQAASTAEQQVVVQSEMLMSWPPSPLPTDYWTRPVIAEFREWAPIIGDYPWYGPGGGANWPADTNPYWSGRYSFVPYTQGPTSAHVVWRRQGIMSGIIGSDLGRESIGGMGGGIQTLPQPGIPSIIYNGRCYQTVTKIVPVLVNGTYYNQPASVWECYDLRTGQVYWDIQGVTAPNAIEYTEGNKAVAGGEAQATTTVALIGISGGRLYRYNALTGANTLNISIPVSSATYYMNGYALSVQSVIGGYNLVNWTTFGTSTNFNSRILSNISYAFNSLPATTDFNAGIAANVVTITQSGARTGISVQGFSLKTGQILWNSTVMDEPVYSPSCAVADHGKIAVLSSRGYWIAWDLNSGKMAWKGQTMDYPWGATAFGAYAVQSAYGLFYWEAYDGIYAYNWTDGKIAWHFESPALYPFDTNYYDNGTAENPFDEGAIVAGGMIYSYNNEHSAISPIARGWKMFCVNATTGEGIWNITTPGTCGPIQDGYMVGNSFYDGYLYVFGKGRSETTIAAPLTSVAIGQGAVITGTVMDKSPGDLGSYQNPTARTDFPQKAPCVSKDSMQPYMDYLYMQIPIPSGYIVTGVPVSIDAIDPSGGFVHIADVTTDVSGSFGYMWKPTQAGEYKVTATFAGDDSYGYSFAETTIGVVETPAVTPPAEVVVPDYTMTITVAAIAIIIAVAIVGLLVFLALRKR